MDDQGHGTNLLTHAQKFTNRAGKSTFEDC